MLALFIEFHRRSTSTPPAKAVSEDSELARLSLDCTGTGSQNQLNLIACTAGCAIV
jgi:hypothetical protein